MTFSSGRLAALLPIAALLASTSAFAFPKYLQQFSGHYETNGIVVEDLVASESCATCHTSPRGGGARNAYGKDFENVAVGEGKGYEGIEFLDSDGDSFNNLEEIYAQYAPGKADSKPAGRIGLAVSAGTLTLTVPSACESVAIKAFGYQIEGKSDATVNSVATKTTVKVTGTTGAILAQCSKESFVGSFLKE